MIRNRNKGRRKVLASDLKPHPKNWRVHGSQQQAAMRSVLEEIGFVGSLLAVERDGGLQLVDGHLRADVAADAEVDVTVVDLSDEEVDLLLATHDTIGEMAHADAAKLDGLVAELMVSSGEVASMLSDYVDAIGGLPRDSGAGTPAGPTEGTCEYPLVPVFNEQYEYALVFCTNATDWGALQTILGLEKERSYKNTGVGVGRVVPFQKFYRLWSEWTDGEGSGEEEAEANDQAERAAAGGEAAGRAAGGGLPEPPTSQRARRAGRGGA